MHKSIVTEKNTANSLSRLFDLDEFSHKTNDLANTIYMREQVLSGVFNRVENAAAGMRESTISDNINVPCNDN